MCRSGIRHDGGRGLSCDVGSCLHGGCGGGGRGLSHLGGLGRHVGGGTDGIVGEALESPESERHSGYIIVAGCNNNFGIEGCSLVED